MIPGNPVSALDLLEGVAQFSRTRGGWRLAAWTPTNHLALTDRLRTTRADAALVLAQAPDEIDAALSWGRPVVNLLEYRTEPPLPCVAVDDVAVGRMGADHLISIGCRELAFLPAPHRFAIEREQGFVERAREAGRSPHLLRLLGNDGVPRLPEWLELADPNILGNWVERLPKPIGIMACNDDEARRLIDACQQCNLRVPDDVAIVGVDNNLLSCQFSPISVTSIDPGYSNIGFHAARMLHALMTGDPPVASPLMLQPTRVVTRRSTDILAFSDPDVREAMRIIRDRAASTALTVDELVNALSISRRSLERKIRDAVGRTPGEEIRRVRMQHATAMLIETEMHIREIAAACGFEYVSHFTNAFRQSFQMSPTTYRSEHRQLHGGLRSRTSAGEPPA